MVGPQESRRTELRGAEDVQARETRRRLLAAYRQAARERLPRPSVTWLCERSGVARSTYYTHFATVDDLAVHAITESFANVSDVDLERRTAHEEDRRTISRAGLTHTVEALEQSRDVLEYAISVGSRAAVLERLVEQFAAFTGRTVATEYDHLPDRAREVVTQFVSAGVAHVLLRWLEDGAADRDELVDQLVDVLPAGFTGS